MLHISQQDKKADAVEVVERKGLGHPDSICDALAESLSRALCVEYRAQFGEIMHHNVDKALLCGGKSAPAFGGGRVLAPIDIYLAGRAVAEVGGRTVPLADIAVATANDWLRSHLRALTPEQHVRIFPLLRPGSQDLASLYRRGAGQTPLANDTSIGVGYWPMSALERFVLAIEQRLNQIPRPERHAAWGEDVKVMGIRMGGDVRVIISCAMIGVHLENLADYMNAKAAIEALALAEAKAFAFDSCCVSVNAADHFETGDIYLTVTGTSAESGDDGQVGRGNRVNGLITPGRPMSLEAAAGKNPVTHVGKLYNVAAGDIARTIVEAIGPVTSANCLLVSQIGAAITAPALIQVKIETETNAYSETLRPEIEHIVASVLAGLPARIDDFVSGRISLH